MANDPKTHGILLDAGTNEVEFLLITLGSQRYGINVLKVRTIQVFGPEHVAPLSTQTSSILGVMPFRDSTISIIDLAVTIGSSRGATEGASRKFLVVAEFNQRTTGFVVDGVDQIKRFEWTQYEPIAETTHNSKDVSILGTVRDPDGLILILDLETIMARLDPSMSVENYAPKENSAAVDRSTVRIVHCDDSTLIQKIVAKVLTGAGYQGVQQFSNGEDTMAYLATSGPEGVDVILSDIEMPGMDGLSLCRTLREDSRFSDVPLLFFSSLITTEMAAKCDSVGGDGAFSKPQINFLVEEIDKLTAARQVQS
ncbi:MAG: chemotaxis protein [Nitrococcus sp.]|nr:chemotaxis protein [Nitrococcus sp.]